MIRRFELDLVRVCVFLLLIIYHASLMFGSRHFFINSPDSSSYFDIIHVISTPWRMSLLFFISGVAVASLLTRMSPSALREKRSSQLLIPFILGMILLIPPQIYVYFNATAGLPIGLIEVYRRYLMLSPFELADGSQGLIVTMEHLWYLPYLWVYTTLLTLLLSVGQFELSTVARWLSSNLKGFGLLIWPMVLFASMRLALRPLFPPTINLVDDWYSHAHYLTCFLGGVFLARSPEFWEELHRMRRIAFIIVLITTPLMLFLWWSIPLSDSRGWNSLSSSLLAVCFMWSVIVAILGYAQNVKSHRHPAVGYANKAILSLYVLHQPVMLLIAHGLSALGAFGSETFIPIIVLTTASCGLLYEGWRRTTQKLNSLPRRKNGIDRGTSHS